MAYEDVLTRVHNRRYIELAFEECLTRKEEQITVIISDLDKFKEAMIPLDMLREIRF